MGVNTWQHFYVMYWRFTFHLFTEVVAYLLHTVHWATYVLYMRGVQTLSECCAIQLGCLCYQGRKCSQGKQDPRWKCCLPGRTEVPADLQPWSSGSGHSCTIWCSCVCFYYLIFLLCKNWIIIIFRLFQYVFIIMPCFFMWVVEINFYIGNRVIQCHI